MIQINFLELHGGRKKMHKATHVCILFLFIFNMSMAGIFLAMDPALAYHEYGGIIIKKNTGGVASPDFGFTSSGPEAPGDFSLAGGEDWEDSSIQVGTYIFTEDNIPANWELTDIACQGSGEHSYEWDLNTRSVTINIHHGCSAVECTFYNEEKQQHDDCVSELGNDYFTVAKWEWSGSDYNLDPASVDPAYSTNISGTAVSANWTSDPAIAAAISKEATNYYQHPGGISGAINKSGQHDISHISLCGGPYCGDENLDNGEECDEGADNGLICAAEYGETCSYCSNSCTIIELTGPFCGDDIKNGDEECDGQNGVPDDYLCTKSCTLEYVPNCGDGVVNGDEECDEGEDNGLVCMPEYGGICNYCSDNCAIIELTGHFCGDNIKNGDEECDGQDGVGDNQECTAECTLADLPYCGDNIKNGDEECDDGPDGSEACTPDCTAYPGVLIIKKLVIGGEAASSDWTMHIGSTTSFIGSIDGTATALEAGMYQVTESGGPDNYALSYSGVCDGTEMAVVVAGATSTCVLTNTYEELSGSIEICKYIDEDGLASTSDDQDLSTTTAWEFILDNGLATTSQNTVEGCALFNNLLAGDYTITETMPDNWQALAPENGTMAVSLEAGENMGVDFVNYYKEQNCGNGDIEGEEECDNGENNGISCQADYGGTCSYCSNSCTIIELTGPYCGDVVKNGDEECDGADGVPGGYTCDNQCKLNKQGGGGGGGGGGGVILDIIDENVYCFGEETARITWRTNYAEKSRVVYDNIPHINIGPGSNYGYASSSIEDSEKTTLHSVVINGLKGDKYYFKPISNYVKGRELSLDMSECRQEETVIVKGEEGEPVLTINKTVGAEFANPGDENIPYSILIINNGNLTAYGVNLVDNLPTGLVFSEGGEKSKTWELGNIDAGASTSVSYLVNVATEARAITYINTAEASASNHDPVRDTASLEVMEIIVLAETGFSIHEFILILLSVISLYGISLKLRMLRG